MQALRRRYPDCRFEGVGGELMLEQGFNSFFPQERLAVMGLVEPLKRLFELLRIRRFLVRHFLANPPDVFIGIDSPDFNLNLELALKRGGVKTVHYVSPSVWAWRQGRIKKIAKAVDLMLTLLPFEAQFYQRHQVPVTFVGHPLADKIPFQVPTLDAREALGLNPAKTYVALLPGSRANEVELLGRVFLETARWCLTNDGCLANDRCLANDESLARDNAIEFLIPSASVARHAQLEALLADYRDLPVRLVMGHSQQVMAAADVVLMASGTTTLEALLLKRPMVIAYKMAPLSYAIMSRLVRVTYVGLPNLLAGESLVPELLQDKAEPAQLGAEILNYLRSPKKVAALQDRYYAIHQQLRKDANVTAANAVAALLSIARPTVRPEDEC